ncbi:hypothetical protein MHO82_07240 [Vibrio sp. Of7-15]|uniref:hypothetical protein n=1 Tax=Vibrio sp. Of7-15 TaxID=2724879 RepID=UPI001EF1DB4B|nr:hypothetical protein [Vibrio sp. Of7-15]MCG7496652.1 hypothetical protein [Vibrio sp. Of7-15]
MNRLMWTLPLLLGPLKESYAWPSDQTLRALDAVQSQITSHENVMTFLEQQNHTHRLLSDDEKQQQHVAWTKELEDRYSPMMAKISSNVISDLLWEIQIENELAFAQVIVSDAKGIIAGQSIVSPNYRVDHDISWDRAMQAGQNIIDDESAIYPIKNENDVVIGAVIYHFEVPRYIRYTAHKFQY